MIENFPCLCGETQKTYEEHKKHIMHCKEWKEDKIAELGLKELMVLTGYVLLLIVAYILGKYVATGKV